MATRRAGLAAEETRRVLPRRAEDLAETRAATEERDATACAIVRVEEEWSTREVTPRARGCGAARVSTAEAIDYGHRRLLVAENARFYPQKSQTGTR
jgi:hypothetical protein